MRYIICIMKQNNFIRVSMNLYKYPRADSSKDDHNYPFHSSLTLAIKSSNPCFASWPRILRSMMRSFQLTF